MSTVLILIVIDQNDTVEHYNYPPLYPSSFQLPQQAQTPLDFASYGQLPFQLQSYSSHFGGSNITWSTSNTTSNSIQSVVTVTPSVTTIVTTVTQLTPTLQTSQPRVVDFPMIGLNDQYSFSSRQRPLHGMSGYPTGSALLPPSPQLPLRQVCVSDITQITHKCMH